jgi:hypothetical protein
MRRHAPTKQFFQESFRNYRNRENRMVIWVCTQLEYWRNNMQSERNRCIELLRETLRPGDKLYTVLRSVSRSGMSRTVDVYAITCTDGQVDKRYWSRTIAAACGESLDKNGAIKVSGCGTDVGFELVYNLGKLLWPKGSGVACQDRCCTFRADSPAGIVPLDKDAVKRGVTPHVFCGRNGDTSGWDLDGGYALKQEWI